MTRQKLPRQKLPSLFEEGQAILDRLFKRPPTVQVFLVSMEPKPLLEADGTIYVSKDIGYMQVTKELKEKYG